MLQEVLVALDLEATGMEPGRDHIIEIGAVKYRGHREVDQFESLVRPDRQVSFSIQSLTGLSNSKLKDAPRVNVVGKQLREFIGSATIVGQSIGMDLDMLAAAGAQFRNRRYDTFELATILLPDLPTYDLGTIAKSLGVEVDDKHRAVADARVSMLVFNRLVERTQDFDDATLQRLMELTRQSRSPLSYIFQSMLRQRRRESESFGENSIGSQLLARLGGSESSSPEAMFLVPRDKPARLEPNDTDRHIPDEVLMAAMSADGPFAQSMSGYEERQQQIDMMKAVATTINQGGQLLVEAGTGTGKSLGYLLPAALHAIEHGEPVVISTATIALQDQLISKDIPALRAAAEQAKEHNAEDRLASLSDLRVSVLKGRTNYLCLRRWFLAQRELVQDPTEAELHAKVTAWLPTTETGDQAELRLSPNQRRLWYQLSEEEGSCIPSQCVFHRRNQCFLFRARHQAEAAHLIVVNHSLLLSDLLRGGSVLPTFRHLIIDEAQHLEDEATRQAGYAVSESGMNSLLRRVLSTDEPTGVGGALGLTFQAVMGGRSAKARELAERLSTRLTEVEPKMAALQRGAASVFGLLAEFLEHNDSSASGYERRVRITYGMRSDPGWSQIEIVWDETAQNLAEIIEIVRENAREVEYLPDEDLPTKLEIQSELELLDNELVTIRSRMYDMLSSESDELICWLARHQTTGEMSLNAVPLHVADILQEQLYGTLESLTLTSATLSTEGTFSFIRDRLALENAEGLHVPSPFDYESSTLVAVADDIPEPNQQGHAKNVHKSLIDLCLASRGRAMILFTSHNALQNSYHAIKARLEEEGILVLGQRIDGSPRQLLERLTTYPETVLLGTNSFWEGVDIVGDALSLLVITRLPFSVPSDPVFSARSELFDNPFIHYAVPQAILRFKQGFGRLIRSSDDRGVVVILDRRVVSRRYGQSFLDSLPPTTVEVAPTSRIAERIESWLGDSVYESTT